MKMIIVQEIKQEQVFGKVVRLMLGMSAFHIGAPGSCPAYANFNLANAHVLIVGGNM